MWPEKTLDKKKKAKVMPTTTSVLRELIYLDPKKKRELIYKDYLICQIAGTEPLFL